MRWCFLLLLVSSIVSTSICQESIRADSVSSRTDTLRTDTTEVHRDSTAAVSGIDTVVNYSSTDSIVYSLPTKTMSLFTNGDIKYRQMELKAERINIDWNTTIMNAFGVPDTSDTAKSKERGTPIMKDGPEEYHGRQLAYNFQTKKGRIKVADTEMDKGYYHGEEIKKVAPDVMFIANGRYTTCDKPDPEYYFASPKMKVIVQDKVVAEPVYFYIADVPVFWLPLAVFPAKGGRRSGIIAPAIAEDAIHGRLLRHLGYYWAINDYMDWNVRSDLYTKGSWALYSDYRYALRYNFTGSVSGNYKKLLTGEYSDPNHTKDESYVLNIRHNQEIDPTSRLDADFTFASNNSFRNTIDLNEALNQSIISNATFAKSWEGTPNSVSINLQRRQNLIDGSTDATLPSISFNHSQSYPFRFSKRASVDPSQLSWYEMIGVSYGASASNRRASVSRSISGVKVSGSDTTATSQDYEIDRSQTLSQSVSMNIAPKIGYFTISPSINYRDDRSFSNNDVPILSTDSTALTIRNDRAATRAGFFSSGISASTKLFGIVQPQLLGVAAIRHTVIPSLSFTYSKQVIGENIGPKQMVASLNVGNILEMKTIPSEEGKEPSKIQLMNIGAGVSYNFSADSLNFSPIAVNYRTGIGNLLDVGGSMGFDLYAQDPVSFQRINKFLISEEHKLARMTNFGISLSTSLAGEKKKSSQHVPASPDTTQPKPSASGYYGLFREEEPDFSIPWRLSLTWDYTENKVQPSTSRSSSVRGNLEFSLTENWKFTASGGYDIINRQVLIPSLNVTRDLHCWIMNFSWVPIGAYRHYQFEIRLKAPQLQDIKVTKQGSASGIY